jgi:segregation and condensation protein B
LKFSYLKGIIESLLFVSEGPLRLDRVHEILGDIPRKDIQKAMDELIQDYISMDRSFYIVEVAGGYQFRTKAQYSDWIKKLKKPKQMRLGQAALETLAIVAYKQPIVRAEIEKIRGVDSGAVIGGLLKKGLIRILGRKDLPGRPIIYGTSRRFLEVFGIKDLSSLPTLKEIETIKE